MPSTAAAVALRAAPVTHIRPQQGWAAPDLPELWRYRELLVFLVWRDIAVRYKQTVIGAAWAIVQPVCTMVVFTVIFGGFAKLPSDGVPYPVFVYAALLPWTLFAGAVTASSQSLVSHANLLTKVYFPRLFIPAASTGVAVVDFALALLVYAGLMAWYGVVLTPAVLLVPILVLLTAVTALGVGLLFASVTVVYRDFRIVVPFVVQMGLFLSPVVYTLSTVPERFRWLAMLNPMTGIIEGFRSALYGKPLAWGLLGVSTVLAVLLLLVGVLNFRRSERRFADVV
ncbi:MAG: ABC transporter permease [Phycisphaerales bacterium]|nr:ABC transporter permease [Phycisphaerales bacterium]